MDAVTAIIVAVAATLVIGLATAIGVFVRSRRFAQLKKNRKATVSFKSGDGGAVDPSGDGVVEQRTRELPEFNRMERKKGVGLYQGSEKTPPRNPPAK